MKFITILITLLLTIVIGQSYGVENKKNVKPEYRQVIDFNKDWLFEKDDWVGVSNAALSTWNDSKWIQIRDAPFLEYGGYL